MRKTHAIILLIAGSAALSACGGGGLFNRDRPDEMAVQRQAPLAVPPDFSLAPPAPGAPRPTEGSASQQALEALFGGEQPRSEIESQTIGHAGQAAPGIRSAVGSESTNTVAKGTVTRDILSAPQSEGQAGRAVIPG